MRLRREDVVIMVKIANLEGHVLLFQYLEEDRLFLCLCGESDRLFPRVNGKVQGVFSFALEAGRKMMEDDVPLTFICSCDRLKKKAPKEEHHGET